MDYSNFDFDIIIQAGQSNAEGMGRGDVVDEYLPNDNVYYLNVAKKVEHTPECVKITFFEQPFSISIAQEREVAGIKIGDFSLSFAKKYVESGFLDKGRKLLIVRIGIGGTGFKKGNWGLDDALYKKMLEMTDYALSLNKNNRVVAFLWHQGEHDAFEGNIPDVFGKQLSAMVSSVRKRYGEIPFIAGDFVREWKQKNIEICKPIVEKIQKVVELLGNAAFVATDDLLSNNEKIKNGDDIHFCRQALQILGQRYFEKYLEIVKP